MERTYGIFYGWTIVGVSFVTLTVSFGIWYSFSVFFVALLANFGWSRAATAGIFSVFMIVHSAAAMVVGPLLDRFGPRWVVPIGSILAAAGLLVTSRIQVLWEFYLFYGVVTAAGLCTTGFVSHSIFLPRWFTKRRGLAMGIAMAGVGVGMLIFVPVSQSLIARFGWRTSYCVLAGIILLTVVPLNLILQRRNPNEVGDVPDGRNQSSDDASKAWSGPGPQQEKVSTEWTLGSTLKYGRFWFLLFVYFSTPLATQGPLVHQVAHMVDNGFSTSAGAFIFGLTGIMGSAGKILFGHISDKIGREKALAIGMGCAFTGILSLMAIERGSEFLPLGYAVLFGLGYGSVAPIYPSRAADLFEGPQFGRIFSLLAIAGGIGGGIGTWLYGKIYDTTASYNISFVIVLFIIVVISVLFWFTSPPDPTKVDNRSRDLPDTPDLGVPAQKGAHLFTKGEKSFHPILKG
jgi:MFS family permease